MVDDPTLTPEALKTLRALVTSVQARGKTLMVLGGLAKRLRSTEPSDVALFFPLSEDEKLALTGFLTKATVRGELAEGIVDLVDVLGIGDLMT